jgi:hypothetical protein
MRFRIPVTRETLRHDAVAGLVLACARSRRAAGVLAGVNPLAALAYLFGLISGSGVYQFGFHGRPGHRGHVHHHRRRPVGSRGQ